MARKEGDIIERYTILVPDFKTCFVCGSSGDIHIHEVFYGRANRIKSIQDGMCVPLCPAHHNMSNQGIHFNKQLDNYVKKQAEKIWVEHYCNSSLTKEEKIQKFIDRYGVNYLDEEELGG